MINREVIYDRNMMGSYMMIAVSVNAGIDERLMLKSKLPGTLMVEKNYVDGKGQYWYNISGKQSLDTYCRVKEIGLSFIERLVISICNEMEILERNLVHMNCLMLDPELVFVANGTNEFIFTLYPGNNTQIGTEFQQLMEYLLTKLDHKDAGAVKAAYGIYEKTLEEGYSILDIRQTIVEAKQQELAGDETMGCRKPEGKKSENSKPDSGKPESRKPEGAKAAGGQRRSEKSAGEKNVIKEKNDERSRVESVWSGLWEKLLGFFRKEEQEETPLIFPEEEIYVPQEQIHPTVCLSSYQGTPRGILMYQGAENLPDIALDARVTRIGQGNDADARIERVTVSQLHARIDRDENMFYIEDLNSTNGTFVNEEALVYKERRQLKINDIVCFADIRYRFC